MVGLVKLRPIGDLNADGGNTWGYIWIRSRNDRFRRFYLQAMFAATGATIVSGAVAERVKLGSFMIFAVLFVGVAYPILVLGIGVAATLTLKFHSKISLDQQLFTHLVDLELWLA